MNKTATGLLLAFFASLIVLSIHGSIMHWEATMTLMLYAPLHAFLLGGIIMQGVLHERWIYPGDK